MKKLFRVVGIGTEDRPTYYYVAEDEEDLVRNPLEIDWMKNNGPWPPDRYSQEEYGLPGSEELYQRDLTAWEERVKESVQNKCVKDEYPYEIVWEDEGQPITDEEIQVLKKFGILDL